jgi:hypothetical protein
MLYDPIKGFVKMIALYFIYFTIICFFESREEAGERIMEEGGRRKVTAEQMMKLIL